MNDFQKEGFQKHREEQTKRWAFETTAEERMKFVWEALEFAHKAGCDYLKSKEKLAVQNIKK